MTLVFLLVASFLFDLLLGVLGGLAIIRLNKKE